MGYAHFFHSLFNKIFGGEIISKSFDKKVDNLVNEGVIEIRKKNNSDFAWIYKKTPSKFVNSFENLSLIEKISKDLINFMTQNSKIGDKLPSHSILSKKFSVSIKTINDVIKNLSNKGFLETTVEDEDLFYKDEVFNKVKWYDGSRLDLELKVVNIDTNLVSATIEINIE